MIKRIHLQLLLLILGMIFMGIGIYTDEVVEVLTKAINICLECIGVG